jgi:hypothetical protein
MNIGPIITFIPFAFRRYRITSVLSVIAVIMALYILFTEFSDLLIAKKKGQKKPSEYQITIYPTNTDRVQADMWVRRANAFLRQKGFESYSWNYQGRSVIDILNLFDRKSDRRTIETILQKEGLWDNGVKVTANSIAGRLDTYTIEFEPGETASPGKQVWISSVEQLLSDKGYCTLADHGYHNPVVLNVGYPPFREAQKLIELIKEKGLDIPSAFSIYENDTGVGVTDNLLHLHIEGSERSVRVSGYLPLKRYTPELYHGNVTFTVSVTDPEGMARVAKVTTHPVTGFTLQYPEDFTPQKDGLSRGIYQVSCFMNDKKVTDTKFELDKEHTVIRLNDKEPQRVFYYSLRSGH